MQQRDILVDSGGATRIVGLGSTPIPSQNRATRLEVDAELSSYGTAPELIPTDFHCSRGRLAVSHRCYFENSLIHTN